MMIATDLSDAARMLGIEPPTVDVRFSGVSTDTRRLQPGSLFVALRGPTFDGNDYVEQAGAQGAAAALVSRSTGHVLPVLQVADTRHALGQLAAAWRRRFRLPVIGVTGSNGKTTLKEMLAIICGERGPTLATRGNLNNDIGVPLTLLELGANHRYAVIEMGANAPGEIAYLAEIAAPDVAVVNNAAAAHLEGFGSIEGVIRAKGEIYTRLPDHGIAVINADDPGAAVWRELAGHRRQVTFGARRGCDVRLDESTLVLRFEAQGFRCTFSVDTPEGSLELTLALAGRHNALNAVAAVATALAAGFPPNAIRDGLAKVRAVNGRLQYRVGRDGLRLIDDTYNANPHSLSAGIDVLVACPGERWLVLGDMAELGAEGVELHAEAGRCARLAGIERLAAVGPLSRHAVDAFGGGATHYSTHEALIEALESELPSDMTALVKGSRSMRMERVIERLVAKDSDALTDHSSGGG